jgi:alanine racemase
MAVLKNDGYGLTLPEYAQLLETMGVDAFAVGSAEEALLLRREGFTADLLLLTPQTTPPVLGALIARNVMLTVGSAEQVDAVRRAGESVGCRTVVHVMVDTGFGRSGFPAGGGASCAAALRGLQIAGAYTHFSAPYASRRQTLRQFHRFLGFVDCLQSAGIEPGLLHCCASGAMLQYPGMHLDMVRLGSALLGRVPNAAQHGLVEAVRLCAPLSEVRRVGHRRSIGYNGSVRLHADTRVGIVNAGLISGYVPHHRLKGLLPVRQYAEVNGVVVPILGSLGINCIVLGLDGVSCRENDIVSIPINPNFCVSTVERRFV